MTPALIGGPDTRDVGRYVSHVTPGARDITGKAKLVQLAGLARHARFVFSEDTPLLHLLVAAGPPALALYGDVGDPALIAVLAVSLAVALKARNRMAAGGVGLLAACALLAIAWTTGLGRVAGLALVVMMIGYLMVAYRKERSAAAHSAGSARRMSPASFCATKTRWASPWSSTRSATTWASR